MCGETCLKNRLCTRSTPYLATRHQVCESTYLWWTSTQMQKGQFVSLVGHRWSVCWWFLCRSICWLPVALGRSPRPRLPRHRVWSCPWFPMRNAAERDGAGRPSVRRLLHFFFAWASIRFMRFIYIYRFIRGAFVDFMFVSLGSLYRLEVNAQFLGKGAHVELAELTGAYLRLSASGTASACQEYLSGMLVWEVLAWGSMESS